MTAPIYETDYNESSLKANGWWMDTSVQSGNWRGCYPSARLSTRAYYL